MLVEFTMEGGVGYFPGLQEPVTIDSAALPDADAAELARLVGAANLEQHQPTSPSGVADGRHYTIVVHDDTGVCYAEAADPITDPALAQLVAFLRKQARAVVRQRRASER